jgi:hypothetical protein
MLGSRPTYFAAGTYGTLAATKDEPESRSSGSSTNSARGVKKKERHAAEAACPLTFQGSGLDFAAFSTHGDLDVRAYLAVQLDGNVELAQLLERLIELHLAAVDGITLLLQRVRDIR